ncbi:hypothetical protein N665_0360s0012 [Sinapis alba]|nr:hypothetical protein N665_0360s0012 [Sinapis alba]
MSNSFGKYLRKSVFGNSLTERTSTKSVLRRRRWKGNDLRTDSVERIDVQRRTTSGCCSQRSCGLWKKRAPIEVAAEE